MVKIENIKGNNTFHIASGQTLTILELAHIVKTVYYQQYNKVIDIILPDNSTSESSDIRTSIDNYIISPNRLNEIGFQCQTDIESGIGEIIKYLELYSNV